MKKGDKLNAKYGTYELAGKWNGSWILSPINDTDNECLAYTAEEIEELIERGEFKRI